MTAETLTPQQIDRALGPRSVGARRAEGPLQSLGGGRWGVPVVAYLSGERLPDVVVKWAWNGKHKRWQWFADSRNSGDTGAAGREAMFG